jgi:hypothetical protein
VFGIVLLLRLLFPPDPEFPVFRSVSRESPRPGFAEGRRFRHPPTRLNPPVSPVPADLWRLHLQIEPADVETLRGYYWDGWRGRRQERPEVRVTLREGETLYTNVALHLKGAAGSFRPFDDKPALTLHFSKHAAGQRFHDYTQISLNNSVQDPSYLSEVISRELFEAAGVPVPRAHHATVLINGRDLGLYVLTEGWGKPFLRRHFNNVSGNLYDGGFLRDITADLDTNSGDHRSDRSDLTRLREAIRESDPALRAQHLAEALDVQRFASFLAMEILTCHWDGYALNRNNYRLFHDVETDRMVFMPHGLDQMFGVMRSSPDSSILPSMVGSVAQAFMATEEGQQAYREHLSRLRSEVFLEERLTNRVAELSRRIRPTLAAYGPDLANQHDLEAAELCRRIVARARSVTEQLNVSGEPLRFDERGLAPLSEWTPYSTPRRRGELHFDQSDQSGRQVLRVVAGPGGGLGGWRTRATLEEGRYRFEGRVQTRGVHWEGTVSLRIRGGPSRRTQTEDGEWIELSCPFAVPELLAEMELVCEFQAVQGEAWFDAESLRLVRE